MKTLFEKMRENREKAKNAAFKRQVRELTHQPVRLRAMTAAEMNLYGQQQMYVEQHARSQRMWGAYNP